MKKKKPDKDLFISITKGSDSKEEYSAYQIEKQKQNSDLKIDLTTSEMDKENFHAAKNVKDSLNKHIYKILNLKSKYYLSQFLFSLRNFFP